MTAKVVDWKEVRKKLPEKPETWKIHQLCEFLKEYGLSHVTQAFRNLLLFYYSEKIKLTIQEENSVDGNVLLSVADDDDLWEDLELQGKDEALLKQCNPQKFIISLKLL